MTLTNPSPMSVPEANPVHVAHQLDQTYTTLAEATARVGEARVPLFLATLALALLSRQGNAAEALAFIAQAERLAAT